LHVISVWSPKGGVGKTTTAAHLSDCLSVQHNKRVIAYDADPQKALFHTYQRNGFAFDVLDTFPDKKPNCDFLVVDFRPSAILTPEELSIIKNSSVVVAPVRASRLDLDSAKAINSIADNSHIINVLSCYDKRVSDQKEVREHLANDYSVISYLSIYARTMNDFKTIFTRDSNKLHGTLRARKEINIIANQILEICND